MSRELIEQVIGIKKTLHEELEKAQLEYAKLEKELPYSIGPQEAELQELHRRARDNKVAIEAKLYRAEVFSRRFCKGATFGRVAIRSSFRSCEVNKFCNEHGGKCAKNEANYAGHIWDRLDAEGLKGATACIALPWFSTRYEKGADWRSLAYWIHDHLPYSELQFFPAICAFNISWHEKPKKTIQSFIEPKGNLLKDAHSPSGRSDTYVDFPPFRYASNV